MADNLSIIKNISESDIRHSNTPKRLEDWIYSDNPQLSIHVVLFNDATLLTVTFLHTLTDIGGLATILKAWTAVLHGKENEVPPMHGFGKNPQAQLSKITPQENYIFSEKVLKLFGMLLFLIRFLFELVWRPNVEEKIIFLPRRYIERIRENALRELADKNDEQKKPFISEGDVIFAWYSRMVLSVLRPALHRPIVLINAFDIRPTLAKEIIPLNSALIGNVTSVAYTFLSTRQTLQEPLSFVAYELRRSLIQQRRKEQIEALANLQKRTIERTGQMPLIGDFNSLLIVCSNWHKVRFFELDFSPAVIVSGDSLIGRSNKLGKPSYIHPISHVYPVPFRNCGIVIGKDADRNWWLSLSIAKEAWTSIENELRETSDIDCG